MRKMNKGGERGRIKKELVGEVSEKIGTIKKMPKFAAGKKLREVVGKKWQEDIVSSPQLTK